MQTIHSLLCQHRDELCGCLPVSVPDSDGLPGEKRFADALATHLQAKERHLFPVLRSVGWSGVTFDMLVEHVLVKRALAEYLGAQSAEARAVTLATLCRSLGPTYTIHLRELQAVIDQHVDATEQVLLVNDLSEALKPARLHDAAGSEGPEALLAEARLVLSSLAASGSVGRREVEPLQAQKVA